MLLRQLLLQTRMLIEHGLHVTRPSAVQALPERTLQMARLEDRILFSASPIAPIVAELADAGSSLTSALFESAEVQNGGLFAIPDQQFLDLVADSLLPAASESQNKSEAAASDEHTLELVFLDSSISNLDQMMADLRAENANDPSRTLEFVTLDSTKDGIRQITSALLRYNVVDGIHIVSHGGTGQVQLGSTWLSINNLDTYRNAISAWQYSMSDKADILFYGSSLDSFSNGQELLSQIATLTATETAAKSLGSPQLEQSVSAATSVAAVVRQELVIVDSQIADYRGFVNDLLSGEDNARRFEVVVLDANRDGIDQISEILAARSNLSAIHLFSHGVDGALELGSSWLNTYSLEFRSEQIARWNQSLTGDADILLYGCDVAGTQFGRDFVTRFSQITGTDISASDDATGSTALGGDWTLEFAAGQMETAGIVSDISPSNWNHLLAISTGSSTSAGTSGASSLTWAHTIGSGNNRILIVNVAVRTNVAVSSVTYGGTALTQIGFQVDGTSRVRSEMWYLKAPTVGTANVVVTMASSVNFTAGATNFFEVEQTTPYGSLTTAQGSTNPSLTVTSAVGELVIDAVADRDIDSESVGAGQTLLWNNKNGTAASDAWGGSSSEAGAASVTMSWTTTGGGSGEWAAVAVSLKAANIAPVVTTTGTALSYTENSIATAIDPGLTVSDDVGTNLVGATVQITSGFNSAQDVLSFASQLGITGSYNSFTGILTLTGITTVANYQKALQTVKYQTTSDNPSASRTISFIVNDGGLPSNTAIRTITVTPVNDAPDVSTTTAIIAYTENDTATAVVPAIMVSDADNANLTNATVSITSNFVTGQDVLAFTNQLGITGSWNASTGVMTLTGSSSVANYQTALRSVTYTNTSDNPSTATRIATVVVNDGTVNSNAGAQTTLLSSAFGSDSGTFTYVDDPFGTTNAALESGTWQSAGGYLGGGLQVYLGPGPATGALSGGWSSTFNVATAGEVVLSVRYRMIMGEGYESDEYGEVVATIDGTRYGNDVGTSLLRVSGTGNGGGDEDSGWIQTELRINLTAGSHTLVLGALNSKTTEAVEWVQVNFDDVSVSSTGNFKSITVAAVNDAPTGTNLSATDMYTEDTALNLTDILVSDAESSSVTVTLTLSNTVAGSLNIGTSGAVTSTYNAGTGVWSASGAIANVNTLLAALTFTPSSNFNGNFFIATSVSDGSLSVTGSKAMTGTAVNDAPTITNAYSHTLTGTNENTNSSGTLASTILTASSLADVDTGAISGLAITTTTGDGAWQYSTDGTTWANFGTVTSTNALLITATTQVRYIPNNNNGETATFSYKAWDQTSGTASTNGAASYATTASSGGTAAFSTSTATASITVTSVNDAPTITNAYSYTLTGTNENTTSSGTLASTILTASSRADVDTGAVSGLAITSTTGNGTWQYSTDGTTWRNFGAVSGANALLVTSTSQVRYIPDNNNGETGTFAYRAWDQTSGTASTNATANYGDSSTNGTTTAYSTSVATASITVASVNDAPVLDNSGNMTLTTITEDATTNLGNTVANIILSAGGDRITDVDSGSVEGIAITSLNSGNGTWQYTTDGGTTWNSVGTVSGTSSLLLRATDSLRFVPNAQNATSGDITFRAWDQSSGTFGTKVDVSTNGTTTAFSTATEVAFITITAVNDAPTITNGNVYSFTSTNEDTNSVAVTASTILTNASQADVDTGALAGMAVTGTTGTDTWQYSTDGTTWQTFGGVSATNALLVTSTTQMRYVPDGQNGTPGTFTYRAWDRTTGTASINGTASYSDTSTNGTATAYSISVATASISVTSVNDAPVLDNSGNMTLTTITEDQTTNSDNTVANIILSAGGDRITDVDTSAVEGIAITATTNGDGAWEYSTDGGTTWTAVGTVSNTSALLLRATDSLRFVPNGQNATTGDVTFRAWDQTTGTFGNKVDVSTNGTTTAFSTATEVASITITAVNDAPVIIDTVLSITVAEDAGVPSGIVGSLISMLSGGVSDVDSGAIKGIAITASVETNGTWYYTTNNGTTWTVVGTVSSASSLLLADNANTRLYFAPGSNYNGTSASALTFRGWDQTNGSAGTKVSTSSNGGVFAFSSATNVVDVAVTAVNDEQVIATNTGLTIAENATGTVISNTMLLSSDVDNTTSQLVYTVSSVTANGTLRRSGTALALNSTFTQANINSGILTYDHNGSETTSDSFSFSVDDGAGTASTGTFNFTITSVNDNTPVITSNGAGATASISIAENAIAVTTVTATDGDLPAQTLTYTIVGGADSALFAINSSTGVLAFVSGRNREANTDANLDGIYDVTVQASDGTLTDTQSISVTITDVDEFDVGAVSDTNAAANSVAENAANGTVVGITASASDADATTNAISYSLFNSDSGRFAINSSTGIVTVAGAIDREADGASRNITIRATSADGSFTDQAFTINITDVDEFDVGTVTDPNAGANSVAENASNGTVVGITALASDVDATTNAITYSLFNSDGGRFAINSGTGVVTVAGAIDREADGASRNITIRATSADDSFTDQVFTIDITDIDEFDVATVSDINAASNAVAENAANGTAVGISAFASDADATTNAITYTLDVNAAGRFAINSSTGVVTVADGTLLNYEAATSHGITVRATSADGSFSTQAYTINLTDVNEGVAGAVTDSNVVANAVNENSANGTTVGITGVADDPDGSDMVTYSLDSDAGGRFAINSTTGVVTVNGAIDREAAASYNITIRATSSDTSFSTQTFTINIDDVDEFDTGAVTDSNAAANSVAENASNGTVVGITASASDADATTNAITYSLFNSDGGRFTINNSTGVVTVAGAIDREVDGASRNITIRATSADGSFTDQVFAINITDVDEFDVTAPIDSNATANNVNENVAIGTAVGITASGSDADATINGVTYSLFDSDGGNFAIDPTTGIVTTAKAIDREALGASRTITVRATSSDGSAADTVFTIAINDLDEFDVGSLTDSNATANTIAENSANGTLVNITGLASDADATTNAITYSLDDNAGGRFAIDSSTGVVTVLDGSLLNYEEATSHGITIRATSADTSFSTQNFTINLTDVNEGVVGAVSDSNAAANYVLENASNETTVGITGLATDPDGTDVVTYSLDSDAGGRFTINSITGVVTVNGAIDREAAASYDITIRATSTDTSSSTQIFTINIGDVNEFAASSVVDSVASVNSVLENASIGTTVGITAAASDADATTNTITYSLFDNDGGRFAINSSSGVVSVAGAINREADGASRNITIRATSADGSFSDQIFSIAIVDVNEFSVTAPADTNATTNAVDENVAIGTVVGITANATDSDATTNGVTYSLFDNDGGNFAIDTNTGVVTTSAALNREALGASRSITVRATSADGSTADTIFTINIIDLDEFDTGSVTDSNATANSIAENSANGTVVNITGLTSDADATTNAIAYSLDDNAGGRFAIDSSTGVVTVLDGILLNYEAATVHDITIRATSADTSFSTQSFAINLTDVNEGGVGAVSDNNAAANYVLENASNGTTGGITGLAADPDGTDTVTYSLDDNAGGRFTINSTTGVVTVNGAIDREAAASYNITVRATSTDTSFSTQTFTINIGDVNEFATSAVSDSNATANSVVENAANGTVVNITGLASDADATTNAITYSLFDNNGGRFAINSSSGVVTVAGAINREADGASRNITIRAASADGSYSDQTFSISIVDANEFSVTAPIDSNASANAVNENATIGTVVGITANATDSDATTNALTYSLFDNDSGNFTIDATTGVVSTAAALNRETPGATRNITVRATSADGSTADTGFTIAINDVNEFAVTTPADVNAASNTVAENASIGAVVGITANATDADATTNTITYTMDNSAGGLFAINGSTGVVTVAAALDYETATSHSITVRATSADGSFATQTFSIAVTDVNESGVSAISDTNATTDFVAENSANGTVVGITAFATDADGTDIVSYSLDMNAGGRFAIDSVTGVVTVAGAINCEAAGTYNITVRATSADGSLSDQTFAIAIVDINEFSVTAPTDSNAAGNAVDENVAIGTVVGITANATDADATTNTITYSLFNNDGGNFNIDTNTGVVTTAAALNRETLGASRSITVRATSADGSTADSVFTININDINEFNVGSVTDSNATANTIAENLANGTVVNITGLASDADATTDTITYSLDDNAGGRFTINSSTGFVTVLDGSLLNFEAATSHNITIRATSADTSFSTHSFTINLTDVNEGVVGAVSDSNAAANYVLENASNGTTVGIIGLATDPDGTDVVTYTLDGDSGGRFTINSITGVVTVNGAIDREAAASYNITVRVTSTDSSFSTQIFTVNIGDINEFATSPVTDADATPNSVVENAANGTVVNITGLASDADATTNTITYSLFDNDGGRFAINGSTGVVTVAGAINREADGASRNITIRATSAAGSYSDQTFFIAIVDANEFSVTAPADTDATANAVNENVAIGTVVGITASSSDSDATTNTVTYSLFDDDGGNFTIDTNTGVVTTAAALNRETSGASRSITVRATSTDGSTADTGFTIAINDVNEFAVTIPTDLNVASNTVAESAAIGAIVGITANATDADATTNTITYTLDDSVGGLFAVDGSTGVVTVAAGLDYETATSHSITVRATSADGSIATQTFNIAVTDVNESGVSAIADSNAAANAVSENALNGTTVGVIASAFDGDATLNGITYSLLNNAGGCFAIDAMTGIVTVANSSLLDREAAAAHTILIQAVSDDGSFSMMSVDIALIDVDEFDIMPAVDINATANLVAELSAQGTLTGITVYASDSDATTNAITYTLDDNAGGKFQINAATGVVTVGATALDYEFATSYSIIVRATSADSSATMLMLTINLTDVNEFFTTAIVDNNTALNEVAENVANGTIVGITALASDGDGADAISYSLDNNAGGRFAIDSLTGVVTVADGTLLNREAAASHNVVIRATSTDGSISVRTFTIALADQNEAPVLANTPPLSVNENTSPGTLVGTVVATDVDSGEVLTYSIVSGDTGTAFTIDARNGQITVLNLSVLNYEAVTSLQFNVMVTDAGGLSDSQTIVIHLNDLNESVTDILIGGGSVAENSAAGTFVGQLTATDPDAGESFTYNLLTDAGGRFVIDASSGRITVVAGAMLNFETASSHVVTAMATDLAGHGFAKSFIISLIDVNDAPVAVNDSLIVTQMKSLTTLPGALLGNDFDEDDNALEAVLVSGTAHGTLILNSDGTLNYTPEMTFSGIDSFSYQVTDGTLWSNLAVVFIEVTPLVGPGGNGGSGSGSGSGSGNGSLTDSSGESSVSGDSSNSSDTTNTTDTTTNTGTTDNTTTTATTATRNSGRSDNSTLVTMAGPGVTAAAASAASEASEDGESAFAAFKIVVLFGDGPLIQTSSDSLSIGHNDVNSIVGATQSLWSMDSGMVMASEAFVPNIQFTISAQDAAAEEESYIVVLPSMEKIVIGSSAVVSTSLSVGYVIWVLRGGSLLTAFLSAMPAWQAFDPLPVLQSFEKKNEVEDDTLLSIVTRRIK